MTAEKTEKWHFETDKSFEDFLRRDPTKEWLRAIRNREQAMVDGTVYLNCPDGEGSDCDECGYACILKPPETSVATYYDFEALPYLFEVNKHG